MVSAVNDKIFELLNGMNAMLGKNHLAYTLIVSCKGLDGRVSHHEYRIKKDQLRWAVRGIAGEMPGGIFLSVPTSECLLFLNPDHLIGARLLYDYRMLETPDDEEDLDDEFEGVSYYLDAEFVESDTPDRLDIPSSEMDDDDVLAQILALFEAGSLGEMLQIPEDEDGEPVFLSVKHISRVEFRFDNVYDFLMKAFKKFEDGLSEE